MDQVDFFDLPISSKTQRSAIDLISINETQFLEKYALQIIKDELFMFVVDSYQAFKYHFQKITQEEFVQFQFKNLNQTNTSYFFAIVDFAIPDFLDSISQILSIDIVSYDEILLSSNQLARSKIINYINFSPKSPLETSERKSLYNLLQTSSFSDIPEPQLHQVIPLYSNFDNHVKLGDLFFIETILRFPIQKLKNVISIFKRKIKNFFQQFEYQESLNKIEGINFLILFNGDINTNFRKIFENFNNIKINDKELKINYTISYISKQSIFYHFKNNNGHDKIEYVDEKVRYMQQKQCQISTFYNINQISTKRSKILDQIKQQKQNETVTQVQFQKKKEKENFKMIGLVGMVCFIGIYIVLKNKKK